MNFPVSGKITHIFLKRNRCQRTIPLTPFFIYTYFRGQFFGVSQSQNTPVSQCTRAGFTKSVANTNNFPVNQQFCNFMNDFLSENRIISFYIPVIQVTAVNFDETMFFPFGKCSGSQCKPAVFGTGRNKNIFEKPAFRNSCVCNNIKCRTAGVVQIFSACAFFKTSEFLQNLLNKNFL